MVSTTSLCYIVCGCVFLYFSSEVIFYKVALKIEPLQRFHFVLFYYTQCSPCVIGPASFYVYVQGFTIAEALFIFPTIFSTLVCFANLHLPNLFSPSPRLCHPFKISWVFLFSFSPCGSIQLSFLINLYFFLFDSTYCFSFNSYSIAYDCIRYSICAKYSTTSPAAHFHRVYLRFALFIQHSGFCFIHHDSLYE